LVHEPATGLKRTGPNALDPRARPAPALVERLRKAFSPRRSTRNFGIQRGGELGGARPASQQLLEALVVNLPPLQTKTTYKKKKKKLVSHAKTCSRDFHS
jgi:hypothetical protein